VSSNEINENTELMSSCPAASVELFFLENGNWKLAMEEWTKVTKNKE
jgi:hypothetical protein